MIQEHHARNLHYDLRLEHHGVLASWALPRGVPTELTKNHLAVRTEDHPLEYGTFEGNIPAGEYGAGTVRIWDSGRYDLEKWRDDEVIATLHGEAGGGLGGPRRFALIHAKGPDRAENNWLIHLMKPTATAHRAGAAQALPRAAPGIRHTPMLATLGSLSDLAVDEGETWAYEMKWDGIRLLASLTTEGPESTVRLITRNGNDVTDAFPDLVRALPAAVTAGSAVLDGEVVALDGSGRPSFGLLQNRTGDTPVSYLVFDLLERDGQDLTGLSYSARRDILDQVVNGDGPVQMPPAFDGLAAAAVRASRELGLEGIVAKRLDGRYESGRRSRSWIKIKHHSTQEVVVGGWRPGKGHRSGSVGSLLIGIPHGDSLAYSGRVGTGFRDRDLGEILDRLRPIGATTSPFAAVPAADAGDAHWVRPILVGEVEFAEWTEANRLRHPVWRGWRPDKSPIDVKREIPG